MKYETVVIQGQGDSDYEWGVYRGKERFAEGWAPDEESALRCAQAVTEILEGTK